MTFDLVEFLYARILPVPIVQRCDTVLEDGSVKGVLFGHPSILYLPSHMSGEFLYETVDRVVPCLVAYTIHLTDGQVVIPVLYFETNKIIVSIFIVINILLLVFLIFLLFLASCVIGMLARFNQ